MSPIGLEKRIDRPARRLLTINVFSEYLARHYPDFDDLAFRLSGEIAFRHSMIPERQQRYHDWIQSHENPESLSRGDSKAVRTLPRSPATSAEVAASLDRARHGICDMEDFARLVSPAADEHLEAMAELARDITRRRFGRTMQLYAPLYLSNECTSICTYCGFSHDHDIKRLTLNADSAEREADLLHAQGIRHILLLTGESYRHTPLSYLKEIIQRLSLKFPSISIEVYPLKESEYTELRGVGLDGLTVYQETYDPERYGRVHLRGMKKRMQFRLDCPDRGGRAGLRRIAVGALLGLSDPVADTFLAALHARYLLKHYWQTQVGISLPRLRPAAEVNALPLIPDRMYARLLCALRILLPDVALYLSTREAPRMRDAFAGICITHMSAGSRTEPGGYSGQESTGQFEIEDVRPIPEIAHMLSEQSIEPVLVDWSPILK